MSKRKKMLLKILSISAAFVCIATVWLLFPQLSNIGSNEEKVYCKATLQDNFTDAEVLITLSNEASLKYIDHEYTPWDFLEIGCVEVQDLSDGATNKMRAQLRGDPKPTDTRPGESWFYEWRDPAEFHRIFCLKLAWPSKLNVLIAIKILEHRGDIYSANPNYIFKVDW